MVIADGWIAGVGPGGWQGTRTIDVAGRYVLPGLIDAHIHIESTLLAAAELCRLMVPRGTTAAIADPHEMANVLGVQGIDLLLHATEGLPIDFFFMASSCVPDARWEDAGAAIDATVVGAAAGARQVLGLAEMMDVAGVLNGAREPLCKLTAWHLRRPLDGHARADRPAADGVCRRRHPLRSRVDGGSTRREKAALGMLVQVREGSSERNLDALLPLLREDRPIDWCLCSDDVHPDDLLARGHLDGLLRRLVAGGVAPARAVRHATLVPARHYGLRNRGAVTPGYRADLAVVDDLRDFRVGLTLKDGKIVAEDGQCAPVQGPPLKATNTMHVAPLSEGDFELPLAADCCPVIGVVPDQIVTRRLEADVLRRRPVGVRPGARRGAGGERGAHRAGGSAAGW
ncbi:MAG: amidohydrolase family protein [Gemmataceae bacterium]